jgi:hypothetical protein
VKTTSHALSLSLLTLFLVMLAAGAHAAPPADRSPATPAPLAQVTPLTLAPAMSQAMPVLTCGPGLILGTYTAYYTDPAKTMYLCEKSCGDTDCTRFTSYFTTSQTCCPRTQ